MNYYMKELRQFVLKACDMRLLNMENKSPLNSQLSGEIDWQFLDKCVVRCTVKPV